MTYIPSEQMQECESEYGVFLALHELLGLPNHITNLELNFVVNECPLVICTYEVQEDSWPKTVDGKIVTETKKYKIQTDNIPNFCGIITNILGTPPVYTKFRFTMKKDTDSLIDSVSYLSSNNYQEKIDKLKSMKTKFNIQLKEIKEDNMDVKLKQLDLLMQKLWTKAVGTPVYDKKEWIKLERGIREIASQPADSVDRRRREPDINDIMTGHGS